MALGRTPSRIRNPDAGQANQPNKRQQKTLRPLYHLCWPRCKQVSLVPSEEQRRFRRRDVLAGKWSKAVMAGRQGCIVAPWKGAAGNMESGCSSRGNQKLDLVVLRWAEGKFRCNRVKIGIDNGNCLGIPKTNKGQTRNWNLFFITVHPT